jgi:hypothetical protein
MRNSKHAAVAVALTAVLTACSEDTRSAADPKTTESATGTPTTQVAAGCRTAAHRDGTALAPGCWAIQPTGLARPLAELDLPRGFFGSDWGVWVDPPKREFWGNIALRTTGDVYRDPCHRAGRPPRVGPTVEDFTRALGAQKLTRTTAPVPVEVDGHAGLYVEVSVPAAVDLSGCPDQALVLWEGPGDEVPQVTHEFMKRYWVLDVDGERVVLAVTTYPSATEKAVRRFSGIVESATFAEG